MGVDVILNNIRSDLSGRIEEISLAILNQMMRCDVDQLERLTFSIISDWTGEKPSEKMLHSALRALTHLRHSPLEMYFIFFDVEDDLEIALSIDEVAPSIKDNYFAHPRTGEKVDEFKDLLIPVFRASDEYIEGMRNER